jgi:hypothetical protein
MVSIMLNTNTSQLPGADRRLLDLGIQLPTTPAPFGSYVETLQTGNLLFLSGMLPVIDHKPKFVGRLGGAQYARRTRRRLHRGFERPLCSKEAFGLAR